MFLSKLFWHIWYLYGVLLSVNHKQPIMYMYRAIECVLWEWKPNGNLYLLHFETKGMIYLHVYSIFILFFWVRWLYFRNQPQRYVAIQWNSIALDILTFIFRLFLYNFPPSLRMSVKQALYYNKNFVLSIQTNIKWVPDRCAELVTVNIWCHISVISLFPPLSLYAFLMFFFTLV